MKPFRTLSVPALLVACLWQHLEAQDPTRSLPTAPAPIKTIPANVVAPQASTGPPFAVVKAKHCEVPRDLCIADYLGIEAVEITGPDSIKKVAPNGQAFKWVLTPWPKLRLYAIPKFDLRASPVNGNPDSDIIKIDVTKHIIATRGLPVQSAGHAQLRGGYDLRLMSWGDVSRVPTSGQNLVIAGTDRNGLLHIRTFDPAGARTDTYEAREGGTLRLVTADTSGRVLSDTPESSLSADRAQAFAGLKQQLPSRLPPHVLTQAEKTQILGEATLITGQTLQGDTLVIDNGSGHYQPTRASVEVWAAPAFKCAGFGNVEVHDHREKVIKGE